MGSAVVAYARPDHLYDLRYSHCPGTAYLCPGSFTPETPLANRSVNPSLVGDAVSLERVLTDYLDPRSFDQLYLVAPGFDVTAFRVLCLGFDGGQYRRRGAIVPVDSESAVRALDDWFVTIQTVLADVVEMNVLSKRATRSYLEARVCEEREGYSYTYGPEDSATNRPSVFDT